MSKHQFKSITDLANALGLSRSYTYTRAKKLNIDIKKLEFSDDEFQTLKTGKVPSDEKTKEDTFKDKKGRSENTLITQLNERIAFLEKQIEVKDKQIDQSQQLQLIAEQRLTEEHQKVLELSAKPKKSFWKTLFG